MTIDQFVKLLLETKVKEAPAWIESFKAEASALAWGDYCDYPLSHGALLGIASGVHIQFGKQVRDMDKADPQRQEICSRAHVFFREIHAKAIESGIDVDILDIDYSVGGD
jgi:hypothetical protein